MSGSAPTVNGLQIWLHINIDNGSGRNSVFGVDEITSNVAVGGPVYQPVIVSIVLDDFIHDPIRMNESPTNHRGRATFPDLLGHLPDSVSIGFIVRIHLEEFRVSLAHSRKHLYHVPQYHVP